MDVPYQNVGPGQKIRLAYQVIGRDGPIPNPQNIRYISPDEFSPSSEPGGWVSGPQALNGALMLTKVFLEATNVAAGVLNTIQLNEVNRKLSQLSVQINRVEEKIDQVNEKLNLLLSKVDVVQKMEAEKSLRDDLRYFMKEKHVSAGQVNLQELALDVLEVIDRFQDLGDIPLRLGESPGLHLSTETRDLLETIFQLMRGTRKATYGHVNHRQGVTPLSVLRMHNLNDYWPADVATNNDLQQTGEICKYVFRRGVPGYVTKNIKEAMQEFDPHSYRLRQFFYHNDIEMNAQEYQDFRRWWVHVSDAGALHRVRTEAEGVRDGYGKAFSLETDVLTNVNSGEETLFRLALPSDEEMAA